MTDYATLKADLRDLVERQDLEAKLGTFIRLGMTDLGRLLNTPFQSKYAELIVEDGQTELPTDFRALENIELAADGQNIHLTATSRTSFDSMDVLTGPPQYYTIQGRNLLVLPKSSDALILTIRYQAGIDALVEDTDTNWVLQSAPSAALYASALHTAPYLIEDERIAVWRSLRDESVSLINIDGELSTMPVDMVLQPSTYVEGDM